MRKSTFLNVFSLVPLGVAAAMGDDVKGSLSMLFGGRVEQPVRELTSMCGFFEYIFYYNVSIYMSVFDSKFVGCSATELEDISQTITEGFDGVVSLDPRLEEVLSLETELCDPIPVNVTGQNIVRERRLFSTSNVWNWAGNGRCRWCSPENGDQDHQRLLRGGGPPPKHDLVTDLASTLTDVLRTNTDAQTERRLDDSGSDDGSMAIGEIVTNFALFNTNTGERLKTLYNQDVIDVQFYGSDLTIVAEFAPLAQPQAVRFGLDGEPSFSYGTAPPFQLGGGASATLQPVAQLQNVGTHFIAATPSDGDTSGSEEDSDSISLFFLVVDGATNAASFFSADPASIQHMVNMVEDDVSFYLSAYVNNHYFHNDGSCLEESLAWIKIEILLLPGEEHTTCLTER